jgi:hypothetical protein
MCGEAKLKYRLEVLRLGEGAVLRRIFEPERGYVTNRRKLHVEFYNLFSSTNIIRMMKSWIMRWEDLVICNMRKRIIHAVLW